ncbi:helix-turn-helix domain-containing protein [Ectothiorhodospira marina]|uniref:Helix-turn-helix n=1 Tax=Ectothiorhodospira marina TaxID=1396821 RepID=A0A1H7N8W9_9GAMM|nr:helix-turn-helix transcriptional regulator [Ectothiorhodospira marina]SEL19438.1 Helix-turn-helix [Ectothiorhodospira marina]
MASTEPSQVFGENLKRIRLLTGMTQEQLAERSGLDRTYVSSVERGKRNISLNNIFKLAEALDVTPVELIQTTYSNDN